MRGKKEPSIFWFPRGDVTTGTQDLEQDPTEKKATKIPHSFNEMFTGASDPSFLFKRQSSRSGFDFAETCSLGISPGRFDMFLSRQDANTTKGCRNVIDDTKKCVDCVRSSCENEPLVNTSSSPP